MKKPVDKILPTLALRKNLSISMFEEEIPATLLQTVATIINTSCKLVLRHVSSLKPNIHQWDEKHTYDLLV